MQDKNAAAWRSERAAHRAADAAAGGGGPAPIAAAGSGGGGSSGSGGGGVAASGPKAYGRWPKKLSVSEAQRLLPEGQYSIYHSTKDDRIRVYFNEQQDQANASVRKWTADGAVLRCLALAWKHKRAATPVEVPWAELRRHVEELETAG